MIKYPLILSAVFSFIAIFLGTETAPPRSWIGVLDLSHYPLSNWLRSTNLININVESAFDNIAGIEAATKCQPFWQTTSSNSWMKTVEFLTKYFSQIHTCPQGFNRQQINIGSDTDQSVRSPKVVARFLLQTLVAISYDYYNCMIQSKRSHILVPNLVAFMSQNEKNVWFFDYHLLTCSVRKMVLICLMQNIGMCLPYTSHQIARLVSHLINHFSKWMFTV